MTLTNPCFSWASFLLSVPRALSVAIGLGMVVLCCQIADADLPTEPGVVHFDLDPVGSGIEVGPGGSLSEFFDDTFNFTGGWFDEYYLLNPADPDSPPLEIFLLISSPGGTPPVESHITLPGGAYLWVAEFGPEHPETNFGYHFSFHNPTSQDLVVDTAVTEGEFGVFPENPAFGFFLTDGSPAPQESGAEITFGPITGDFISFSIMIPEPGSLLLALCGGCSVLLFRRRAEFASSAAAKPSV